MLTFMTPYGAPEPHMGLRNDRDVGRDVRHYLFLFNGEENEVRPGSLESVANTLNHLIIKNNSQSIGCMLFNNPRVCHVSWLPLSPSFHGGGKQSQR